MPLPTDPRLYPVSATDRAPLVRFIERALETSGCRLLHVPDCRRAPFRFTFETPAGERLGLIAYAFFANSKSTRNRPSDEHRFQLKYGTKEAAEHDLWRDPTHTRSTPRFFSASIRSEVFRRLRSGPSQCACAFGDGGGL